MKKMIFETPLGKMAVYAEKGAITEIDFFAEGEIEETDEPVLIEAKKQLTEYFEGKRKEFSLRYVFSGTEFQKAVWHELEKIPFGETRTYGEIAAAIGKPKAARAVGGACNKNCVVIIVPCHRVVGAGGKLVGFACGTDIKEWLLGHEAGLKGEQK